MLTYIGIGSNVGDRLALCQQAIREIATQDILIRKISSLYETEPMDYLPQGFFYNAVIEIETALMPRSLLKHLQAIEHRLDKNIKIPKGPRTIDLDILFYQDAVIDLPDLIVPHPQALTRRFVLIPMAEIAPDFIPPNHILPIKTICDAIIEGPVVRRKASPNWIKGTDF